LIVAQLISTIPVFCKTGDSLPSSQEPTTDLSEPEESGRILIIDIAAAAATAVVSVVMVVVVVVAVGGFSETDATTALSNSRGVEGATAWQTVGPRRKAQVTIAI
jgi:hypothetical protein